MELWWKVTGTSRLRLTSGALLRRIDQILAAGIRLEELEFSSGLEAEFTIRQSQEKKLRRLLRDDKLEVLHRSGGRMLLAQCRRNWILLTVVAVLIGATLWVPSRIFFIRVSGNGDIPQRRILEAAEQCGVYFGAPRGELRSEQVKNKLLKEIPQLSWAGVNTKGCVATISVAFRASAQEPPEQTVGSIVAVRDALVTEVTATSGRALCAPGQTVQAGQVLISGYVDLGLVTRLEAAEGEIYGITKHRMEAVLPLTTRISNRHGEVAKKYSILFGKKRINFYSDSGILYPGCGKIRKVNWLTLPGGWELPIALVEEWGLPCEQETVSRADGAQMLAAAAEDRVRTGLIAGEIVNRSVTILEEETVWHLSGVYECREMIGRKSQGVYLEGDNQ